MNDHNLDDLIIDNIQTKNGKGKSLLTIIALLIVVLIVAIILTKTLLKSPTNPELAFDENNTEMIAPELKLQDTPKVAKVEKNLSLPTITVDESTEAKTEVKKPTVALDEDEIIVEKPQPAIERKAEPKQVVKPKATVPKTVTKVKTAPKVVKKTTTTPKVTSSGKYYVQVGAFTQAPSTRLLSVIKNSGFAYSITAPEANGNKRVLIGPYKSRAEVDNALKRVRDRITKTAFVYQK